MGKVWVGMDLVQVCMEEVWVGMEQEEEQEEVWAMCLWVCMVLVVEQGLGTLPYSSRCNRLNSKPTQSTPWQM
jgi:hypothetical protein